MNTFTLGVRNAFRNSVRALSIIVILGLSIGLCLIMLLAHQAVSQKISDVKSSVGTTITITPAGFSNFSDANNALTTAELDKLKTVAHITGVTESLDDRLTTTGSASLGPVANSSSTTSLSSPVTLDTNGAGGGIMLRIRGGTLPANFSLPVAVLGTTNPTQLNGNTVTLKSGAWFDGTKDANVALVSTDMASKNNLQVGSTFTAYDSTLTVSGIFDSGTRGGNNTVILALPTLQRLSGQGTNVTNALATVDSLDNLTAVTTAVKNTLGSSADVQSSLDLVDATVKPLENVQGISLISLIGAVIAGSVIILLTMVMIVRERRREIGILKAIGASNTRVVLQFMSEAVTLTVAGALIGALIGIAGGNPVTNMLVSSSAASTTSTTSSRFADFGGMSGGNMMRHSFSARPATGGFFQRNGTGIANTVRNISVNIGWNILAYGLAAALLIAAVGSSFAGWMIARVKPYEVMRME